MRRHLFIIVLLAVAVRGMAPAQEPERVPATRDGVRGWLFGGRQDEEHTVNLGETAYSVARRYGVLLSVLVEENPGFDPAAPLVIGQRLRIPRRAVGTASPEQIDAEFARYQEQWQAPQALDPTPDTLLWQEPDSGRLEERYTRPSYSFRDGRPLHVALLLPFTVNGRPETSMADYYRGTLLGLQDLKAEGISIDLSVFDTRGSVDEVRHILRREPQARSIDLIIGPRNDAPFDEAAHHAWQTGTPIVSPQSVVEGGNPFVFQVRPASEYQFDKLRLCLTAGDPQVVLIVPEQGADADFLTGIEAWLPFGVQRIEYAKTTLAGALGRALSRERENIVIVPTATENMTDEILAILSSVQNSASTRTGRSYAIRVAGSPQWARFRNNDRELFFKLQAMYPTLYYADRTDSAVGMFERRYLEAFGALPSLFSYRGYDVAKLFVTAVHDYGNDYDRAINRVNTKLLQVPYHFERDASGKWVNDQWVLVSYSSDYRIEVQ